MYICVYVIMDMYVCLCLSVIHACMRVCVSVVS